MGVTYLNGTSDKDFG
uniref:Uncharacterized protein n=1 Tax=Arundo donax TaxID=35708 RepID=A0A0A9FMW9_ARUDO